MSNEIKEIKEYLDRRGIKYHENHFGSGDKETTEIWFNICKTRVQITDYYGTPGLIFWNSQTSVDGLSVDEVKERLRETAQSISPDDLDEAVTSLRAYCALNDLSCTYCHLSYMKPDVSKMSDEISDTANRYCECGIGWPLDWGK